MSSPVLINSLSVGSAKSRVPHTVEVNIRHWKNTRIGMNPRKVLDEVSKGKSQMSEGYMTPMSRNWDNKSKLRNEPGAK